MFLIISFLKFAIGQELNETELVDQIALCSTVKSSKNGNFFKSNVLEKST